MALTDYDKKNLSTSQQKKIQEATDKWNAANAKGDTKGMESAAAEAAAIRNSAGYTTDSSGNYKGSYSPTSSGGGTKAYTSVGTYNDAGLPDWVRTQIDGYKSLYTDAMASGNTTAANEAHNAAEALRKQYGYSGGTDGSEYIRLGYDYTEPKPTYESKYDPQMDALLDQILNRDSFSYDVATDPMYQQYAKMYQREGDRAMSNTMAEAAAGAGGMNSYAITAAQQANNYYNSQLNDVIPELYNTAYQMYLQDIDNKVRDLGLLQNMDSTQYARYRDTMADRQSDRNFAYGMYRDDIADSQWNRSFDYNSYVDNRNYDYTQSRDNVYDTQWDKEFNATQGQIALENSWRGEDNARADVEYFVSLGVMPDDATISRAGLNRDVVAQAVEEVKKKELSSGSKGRRSGSDDEDEEEIDTSNYTVSNNNGSGWVTVPGFGRLSYQEVMVGVEKGTIKEEIDHETKTIRYRKV